MLRRLVFLVPVLLATAAPSSAGEEKGPAALAAEVSAERLEKDVRTLAAFGTRHTASDTASETRGIGAARRFLEARFREIAGNGPARVEVQTFTAPPSPRLKDATEVVNLLLVVPGTEPTCRERLCVVSGHYDSRASDGRDAAADAPGANDDASGTALALELARIFAASPRRATVVLACVGGEEQGLLGSAEMARRWKEQGARVEAMFTDDIVGNTRGPDGTRHEDHVRVFSEGLPQGEGEVTTKTRIAMGGESDGPSRQLARFVREAQAKYLPSFRVRLVFRPDRFLRGGDHTSFSQAGFAAVRFTEPVEDFDRQHQDVRTEGAREYGDVPDSVDYAYLADVTRVNAVSMAALADAPGSPGRPRIHTAQLEHATTLSWDDVKEEGVAGYEVVWRDTTAPDWEHKKDVGPVTTATLDVSKDDVHFGVRTYDAAGRKSPVAYPFPER